MDASLKQLAEKSLSNCSLAALGMRGGVLKEHQLDRKDSLFIGSGEGFEAGVQEEWGLMVKPCVFNQASQVVRAYMLRWMRR